MSEPRERVAISVVIPTVDRSDSLTRMLASLERQSLCPTMYEIVVVDDGSTDDTAVLCRQAADDGHITYVRLTRTGIARAKNVGLLEATGHIVLFLDDDDIADRELLEHHVHTHRERPELEVAVLGFTTWAATLAVTPLMRFVTEVGQHLFAYPSLTMAEELTYDHFWGGRTSCKRELLLRNGMFNPAFDAIIEDIELGYRLSKVGMKVVYEHRAVLFMARPVTYVEFATRCERRGRGLAIFASLHREAEVYRYCRVDEVLKAPIVEPTEIDEIDGEILKLEKSLTKAGAEAEGDVLAQLHELYWRAFTLHQLHGFQQAGVSARRSSAKTGAEFGDEFRVALADDCL